MPITAGTHLGRYEIRSKIGEGGMGEVYRAFDPKINREVAIKVLPAAFSADKDRLARFEQEAQAAGALNHPNILSLYDVDTHDGSPYVVSELLDGETLHDRMSGAPLPSRKALDYALQLAKGLATAHELVARRAVHSFRELGAEGKRGNLVSDSVGRPAIQATPANDRLRSISGTVLAGWSLSRLHLRRVRTSRSLRSAFSAVRRQMANLFRRWYAAIVARRWQRTLLYH